MRKSKKKKSLVVLCVIIPIATALAFVPKMLKAQRKRKHTELF